MPFRSAKQRRYLWANEPKIARRWTKEHGSRIQKDNGGIMRIPFANGLGTTRLLNEYIKDYPLKDVLNLDPSLLKTFEQDPRLQKDPELAERQKGRWGYTYAGSNLDPRNKGLMDFYLGMGINPSDPNLYIQDLARFGEEAQNPNYREHQDDLNRRIAEVIAHEGRHRLLKKNPQFEESISADQPWGEFDKHERLNLMLDYLAGSENLGERMDKYQDINTDGWSSLHPEVRRNYDELYKTAQAFNKGMLSNYERTGGISNLTDPDLNMYINESPEIFTPQRDEDENVPVRFRDAKTLAEYNTPRQRALRQSNRYWNRGDQRTGPEKWMGNIMGGIRNIGQGIGNFMGDRFKYRPAVSPAGGYSAAQLNQLNARGGYYSPPARQQRQDRARVANLLARKAADKPYSQANLNQLTMGSRPGHYDPPGGDRSVRGTSSPSKPDGWHPGVARGGRIGRNEGGLASIWPR